MTKQKNKNHIILFFLICFLFFIFPLFSVKADCCKQPKGYNDKCSEDIYICKSANNQSDCSAQIFWLGPESCSEQPFCKETGCCKKTIGNNISCSKKNRMDCQDCFFPGQDCNLIIDCKEGIITGCCIVERNGKFTCADNVSYFGCPTTVTPKQYFESGKFCADISNCPQYTGIKPKEEETKPAPPLKFIPSVTIPNSIFEANKGIDVSGKLIGQYISAIFEFAVAVSAFLALVMIMLAGVKWMLASGSSEKVGQARKMIGNAIIGLFLALATYTILSLINPNLVFLKNINVTQIKRIELEFKSEKGAPIGGWTGKNITTYDKILKSAADMYGINCARLKAHMLVESGGRPNLVSNMGACGLIQLLPKTANITCEELKYPETNIFAAAKFYNKIRETTCPKRVQLKNKEWVTCEKNKTQCENGAIKYVTAAYNGGVGANCDSRNDNCQGETFWECEKNTGYNETRKYVEKIEATYRTLVEKGWGC